MLKLKQIEKYVYDVLEQDLEARQDDFVLYDKVIEAMGFDTAMPLKTALIMHKQYKLPSFESVSRCRRHIQELVQKLNSVSVLRENAEEDYKEYNRSGIDGIR